MTLPTVTFSSARTRLTLTYLGIIMALTFGFSAVFYNQSINEAKENLQRQEQDLRGFLYFATPENIAAIRNSQLRTFRSNLLNRLAVVNLGMLVLGGGVSYVLARRSLRPLEETMAAQSRFTSDAAHELRTPLTAMKTEIEVYMRDKNLTVDEARGVLKSNLEEVNKLESLTNALLRLARSGESVDRSNWQDYKLQDILATARDRLADKAKARKIIIKLPKTTATVHGDPDQLVELFVTLLGNAIKYSNENSVVTITTTASENRVSVDVKDQGIGIADIDLPHIFERFYRADPSRNKTKADGYGLGLSLAEAIVNAHNGKISVQSTYGKGSIFTVELPSA